MSHAYRAVGWNRQKKLVDASLAVGIGLYLVLFLACQFGLHPTCTIETALIRAFGTAALLLLHIILSIGPLCRLDPRHLPLLYNRRHLGVAMFLLALAHGGFSLVQFHALGNLNPFVSLFVSNTRFASLPDFPFQCLGFAALTILFLMAATSHDFWLANLTAPVWKTLHMSVYAAYALIILHVALGVLQAETSPVLATLLGAGLLWVLGLHLAAGQKERRADAAPQPPEQAGYADVCAVADIPEKRARVVLLGGERVAIFRYDGKISALSSICQHQNGPLGEGCIIDGLVTCPWHGYQYAPDTGASPPPFTESVPTFRVRVENGRVLVDPRPCAPGTRIEPARIAG